MFEIEIKGIVSDADRLKRKRKMVDSDSNSDTLVPDFKNSDTTVLLRKILESISDLVKECEINATEEGLTIQVMDPLHASISDIFISKKNFDTYRCDHSISIGIKLKDFLKILKSLPLEKNYSLKISCKDDADTMSIEYNVENYALKFALMLYTLNCEKYHFPAQKFDVEVEMPTRNFFLVHRIVGTFDEHLLIVAKDKSLIFSQGGETTKSSLAVTEGEDVKMIIGCEMKKEIAMKYVKSIAKAVVLSDNMKICMGESTPVFFEFTLNEGGYIRFFIAPKVDDEE